MNKMMMVVAAAGILAGCVCDKAACGKQKCCCGKDPVIGNWSAQLPYEKMAACSMIFSRNDKGEAQVLSLYRDSSPVPCKDLQVCGNRFSFTQPNWSGKYRIEGEVMGDRMLARIAPCDKKTGELKGAWQPFEGVRNPPIREGVRTSDAKLGEPIDLLKDGVEGWTSMDRKAKFGWMFRDGVLSNRIGGHDDIAQNGRATGANLMTKRADFYDFNLEYDVRVPKGCNSGVYLRGRFEIQTVDSYGNRLDCHNMAAYYGRVTPTVSAEKPAGEWQHVSVTIYKRHLTVVLNGTTIIDNAPVVGVTGGAIDANLFAPGPIYLQGDHSDADYKNMILRPAM